MSGYSPVKVTVFASVGDSPMHEVGTGTVDVEVTEVVSDGTVVGVEIDPKRTLAKALRALADELDGGK